MVAPIKDINSILRVDNNINRVYKMPPAGQLCPVSDFFISILPATKFNRHFDISPKILIVIDQLDDSIETAAVTAVTATRYPETKC